MPKKEVARRYLADFASRAAGLDRNGALRIILLAAGRKPAAYVPLRITPSNLDEKSHFERHVRNAGFCFHISRPMTFEVIEAVKGNRIIWKQEGLWFGYDIFATQKEKQLFRRYEKAARARNHALADRLGAQLYGYPQCCARAFHREHDPWQIALRYTSYEHFKRVHDAERAFPFAVHKPCSPHCRASKAHNAANRAAVRTISPRFFSTYTTPVRMASAFIVEGEHDVFSGHASPYRSVWSEKDGHEYSLLARKKFSNHHYMHSYLTKRAYARGTRLYGTLTIVHNYADITIKKVGSVIKDLHHVRRFPLLAD